jgi:hypothetical protein
LTITAANLQTQEFRFQTQSASGRWSWVTVVDLSRSVPIYRIERIVTPYGLFRDSIPLPGDVVIAFAESISTLQTQFPPRILIGPPSSLVFTLDEGRGFSEPEVVVLTNNGIFGSLLGVSLTSSASYIEVTPSQVGNLASNESGEFSVTADSTELIAADSPYEGTITVVDPQAINTPQTLPITINVRPKAVVEVAPVLLTFTVVKPASGPFPSIPNQTFEVQNTGPSGSVLDWQIQKVGCANWLTGFFPVTGTLASGDAATITVAVAPPTSTVTGTFTETLRVSGYSENQFVDMTIQLVVS